MYKIAVIGDRQSIMGYGSLGLETFETNDAAEAAKLIVKLAETDFAVIYITEKLFSQIGDTVAVYRRKKLPAIIPIPGVSGNTGIGIKEIHAAVEKAVGSDIL
ncbi:MAG: V-type ATP synthase subunit F [Acutalibacteraceae bacterium]